jgi:hypothetical protein
MKVAVDFTEAPSLAVWQEVLTPSGWKITKYTDKKLCAKNEFGESKFPIRHSTTWQVTIHEREKKAVTVRMDVPAFAESDYAENRMLKKIADITDDLDGECVTDDDLSIDVLKQLRNCSG